MQPAFFFDDGRGQLSPLTDLRPACAVRTGAFTGMERLRRVLDLDIVGVQVPAPLEAIARESLGVPVNTMPTLDEDARVLFINSRCPLPYDAIGGLAPGECLRETGSGDVVAGRGTAGNIRALLADQRPAWRDAGELPAPALLARPWHVRTFRDRCLALDLAQFRRLVSRRDLPGVLVVRGASHAALATTGHQHPAIMPHAMVYPSATIDVEHGEVVIDQFAVVRPHALIIGPAYIGPHVTVLDKALIKPNTAIGPHCKVAGEVGGTIFQGFSNKAHDGHLGDSYVGEWANLGAGTTNSNLLNTYAEVIARATPAGSNERTGEQFLGCILGDHVKMAISTRIMTGAVVHTGTMWAAGAAVTGCVPAFSWATDAGTRPFRIDKFLEVARTVMARRKVVLTAAYESRVRSLAALA